MQPLLYTLGLISGGLLAGYLWQLAEKRKGDETSSQNIARRRKLLQKIGLLGFMPLSFVAAVWIVSLSSVKLLGHKQVHEIVGIGQRIAVPSVNRHGTVETE